MTRYGFGEGYRSGYADGYGNADGDGYGYGDGYSAFYGRGFVYCDGRGYGYGKGLDLSLRFLVVIKNDNSIAIGCETETADDWLMGDHSALIRGHDLTDDEVSALRRYVEQLARWLG